jgi:chromosome segregation ATPase
MKAENKKIKKAGSKKDVRKESHTDEIKRYIGAVTESFQGSVSAIAEQFLGLNKKVDLNTEMTGHLLEEVTLLKEEMKEVKSELKGVQGEVKGVQGELKITNERLSRIEQAVKEMKDEIKELKNVLKNKADIERVELLESRLYQVEERLKSHA